MGKCKVMQVIPSMLCWTQAFETALRTHIELSKRGYESYILSDEFDPNNDFAHSIEVDIEPTNRAILLEKDDILVLYQDSNPIEIVYDIKDLRCRKVLFYEGIMLPGEVDKNSRYMSERLALTGKQLAFLSDSFDYCLSATSGGKSVLKTMGYSCPIELSELYMDPALTGLSDKVTLDVLSRLRENKKSNIVLYRDLVAPGYHATEVINAFAEYKRSYDSNAVLLIAMPMEPRNRFRKSILNYAKQIGLEPGLDGVLFLDGMQTKDVAACYGLSDVAVSLSYPGCYRIFLAEAARYEVPVLTYGEEDGSRVGLEGFSVSTRDPHAIAAAIDCIVSDSKLSRLLVIKQKEAYMEFGPEKIIEVVEKIHDGASL